MIPSAYQCIIQRLTESIIGEVPERLNGPDCKSGDSVRVGSNPTLPTTVGLTPEECATKADRVRYYLEQLAAGAKFQGPRIRELAVIWGVDSRHSREALYEARRSFGIVMGTDATREHLTDAMDGALDAANQTKMPHLRAQTIARCVEVYAGLTGASAPQRLQVEQVSVLVTQELVRLLRALAEELEPELYLRVVEIAKRVVAYRETE